MRAQESWGVPTTIETTPLVAQPRTPPLAAKGSPRMKGRLHFIAYDLSEVWLYRAVSELLERKWMSWTP